MEFSHLSLVDLRALEQRLSAEIEERQQADIVQARQKILALAQSAGIPLKDLLDTGKGKAVTPPRKGRTVAPKYRHPHLDLVWTGRGRKPGWILELLAKGHTLDDLLIKPEL